MFLWQWLSFTVASQIILSAVLMHVQVNGLIKKVTANRPEAEKVMLPLIRIKVHADLSHHFINFNEAGSCRAVHGNQGNSIYPFLYVQEA